MDAGMDEKLEGQAEQKALKNELWEWIKAFLIAVTLVFLIRYFLFTPTVVSGPSMHPNFFDRERLIVNKLVYDYRDPKRGEVVIFHASERKDYIKRVIALPGETVRVSGDEIYINGQVLDEPYIAEEVTEAKELDRRYNTLADFPETEVPENHIFVLGDNRPNSTDSRFREVGFVSMDQIVGKVQVVFWPLARIEWVDLPEYKEAGS